MQLILKVSAGVVLGVVLIAAWYTWRQDAADKAFVAACLANDHAAAMDALVGLAMPIFLIAQRSGETPAYSRTSSAPGSNSLQCPRAHARETSAYRCTRSAASAAENSGRGRSRLSD